MIFTRIDPYHERSDCSRFTVAAMRTQGANGALVWRFAAWRTEGPELIEICDAAAAARARCEKEAATMPAEEAA